MAARSMHASLARPQVCSSGSPRIQSSLSTLTLGIELEFIVLSPPHCFASLAPPTYGPWTALTFVYHSLVSKGIPAKVGITPISSNPEDGKYTCWNVHHDNTLRLTDEEAQLLTDGYDINPLELASRVLSLSTDNWQEEVAAVLETIQSLRNFGCHIITNQHCGLHVHVGFGKQQVPIETCKTVLQVATAMERCFDQLHTTSRMVPGEGLNFNVNKHFNAPLGWFHQKNFEGIAHSNVFQWLSAIEKCEDQEDLQDLFMYKVRGFRFDCQTNGHNSTVNFDNCSDDPDPDMESTGTIEFRQHEGTLNLAAIAAWVKLTTNLVLFCRDGSDLSVIRVCGRASDPSYGFEQMMRDLGCDDSLMNHYQIKLSSAEFDRQLPLILELDRARARGSVEDILALEVENAISKFQRENILAVNGLITEKSANESYGKIVRFDSEKRRDIERALLAHAAVLKSGKKSNLTAKGVAFRYMQGKTCPWLE